MRIKPRGILKLIHLNLRITSHLAKNIQRPHVSRFRCCKKTKTHLKLSHSALLLQDNTLNSFLQLYLAFQAFCFSTCICIYLYVYTKLRIDDQANVTGNVNLLTIRDTLKSSSVHKHTFSHPLFNLYLK